MTWALREKCYSQRWACRLVGLQAKTYRYASKRPGDEGLRRRLRELAFQRRRFGYRVNRPGSTSPGGVYLSVSALHEVVGGALSAPPT